MKKTILLIFFALGFIQTQAQVTYTMSSIPYAPDPFTNGTNLGLVADDIYSGVIPIGFNFSFFGNNYSDVVISTNGSLTFDLSNAGAYCPWNITTSNVLPFSAPQFNNTILSPFQDLNPASSGATYNIRTAMYGVAPYRRFVVSYENVSLFSCTAITFSNQVILYETTYDIVVNIQDKYICSWNNGAAVLGIQDSTGTVAYVPSGRNVDVPWSATQESWKFSPSNGGAPFVPSCLIKGNVFFDQNSNCLKDGSEYGNMNRFILSDIGNYYAYTDINGDYSMNVDPGNYVISHSPYGNVAVTCPALGTYAVGLANAGDSSVNNNFADSTNVCADLFTSVNSSSNRYCHNNLVTVIYGNQGSIPEPNATLTIEAPSGTFASNFSSTPTTQVGNTYTFNLGQLTPGQIGFITYKDSIICDTTLVGTNITYASSISGSLVDCDMANNTDSSTHIIVASLDPNDITAVVTSRPNDAFAENGSFNPSDWVTYNINFQNTGSADAIHIRVEDLLDPNLVDISTVHFMGSSHLATMIQQGPSLKFYFNDINLPDSTTNELLSHGWVKFKVKAKSGLANNTYINNMAGIYFDNNSVVNTNTSSLVHFIPEGINDINKLGLRIYPNPMSEQTKIELNQGNMNGVISLFNSLGQLIVTSDVNGKSFILDRNNLPQGLYQLVYKGADGKHFAEVITVK